MTSTPSNDWNDCPPGEIAGLVQSLKKQRQRKTFQQAAGVTGVVVLLVFAGSFLFSGWFLGGSGIACKQVRELAPQYVTHALDQELTAKITHHLKTCDHCRTHFETKYPQFPVPEGTAQTRANSPPVVFVALSRSISK